MENEPKTQTTPAPAPSEPASTPSSPEGDGDEGLGSLFNFSIGDSEGEELPFDISGLSDDGDDEPASEPAAAAPTSTEEKPTETSTSSSLEKAKAKLAAKLNARKERDLLAELRAEKEELEKKANRKLSIAEINAAAKEYLEVGKTPEQEEKERLKTELEELKAWKQQQEAERRAQAEAAEREQEVAAMADHLEAVADDYPFLSSSGWGPQFVLAKCEELVEKGECEDLPGALARLEEYASLPAKNFKKNKRALKAMFQEPEGREVLIEVLGELGITPAKAKAAIKAALHSPPTTLTGDLKRDAYPVHENGSLPSSEDLSRNLKRAVYEMQRAKRGLQIDGEASGSED